MKILETQSATLTNYEVLKHLETIHSTTNPTSPDNLNDTPSPTPMKSGNLETVVKEVTLPSLSASLPTPPPLRPLNSPPTANPNSQHQLTDYLLLTPSTPLTPPSPYTESTIRNLLEALREYELTKAELVMILNLRPDNAGVLDCVVEELDQRFSEAEQEAILGVVSGVLGAPPGVEGDGKEGG